MIKTIAMASVSLISLALGTAAVAQQGAGTAAQEAQGSEDTRPNNDIIVTATKVG